MNENIDLTKILKNCPKGTKLYSTIFGEVEFIECDDLYQIVVAKENKYYYFTSQGAFYFERIKYHVGECVLFPSKDQRDWSKFTAPWYKKDRFDPKTLKPFDKVLVKQEDLDDFVWSTALFSHLITIHDDVINIDYLVAETTKCTSSFCIPYNEDTKHLVGITDEAPKYYRYWEE